MLTYVDHVLALLPFEPEAYRRLRGPPCSYVGHPLTEQLASCGPVRRNSSAGTRRRRCCWCCPAAVAAKSATIWRFRPGAGAVEEAGTAFEPVLPTMPHLQEAVAEALKGWPIQPRVVIGEQEKRAAFRIARAALAKSGTVTLELALSGVPMVTAYRTGSAEAWILRRAIKVNSVILANLVIGDNVISEFLQEDCTPEKLSVALREVLGDTALRRKQSRPSQKSTRSCRPATAAERARRRLVLTTMRTARR